MSSEHSLSRPFRSGSRAILFTAGLAGDALAVVGVMLGLNGNVDFAKTWGAVGLLVGVLSMCVLYLADPPKARRETRAMTASETPLRRRRRRRRRGLHLRLPFLGQGWSWSDSSGYVDHGYYTRFDDDR